MSFGVSEHEVPSVEHEGAAAQGLRRVLQQCREGVDADPGPENAEIAALPMHRVAHVHQRPILRRGIDHFAPGEPGRGASRLQYGHAHRVVAHVVDAEGHAVRTATREHYALIGADQNHAVDLRRRRQRAGKRPADLVVVRPVDLAALEPVPEMPQLVLRRLEILLDARQQQRNRRFRFVLQQVERVLPRAPEAEREHGDDGE